jgi:large subunit ribosomal protein L21
MKYAIIESGGKQYKAVEGGKIEVDLLPIEPGNKIQVGTPTVAGANVAAKVVDHIKGEKLTVFKYRPKKRIRVKTGHRQKYTLLQIEKITE